MKNLVPAAFMGAMLAVVGVVAVVSIRSVPKSSDASPLVDDSLANGSSWIAGCPSMDGGVDDSLLKNFDGGVNDHTVTDFTVTNTSSTCVRFGFDSTVDQNHGVAVGTGSTCAAGPMLPIHGKTGRCQSEGARVLVNVTGGKP